jgi:NitT/TauT family transport system ATP-binding protein
VTFDPVEGERPIPHVDAIAVSDLSKRYTTRDGAVTALEGISFGVAEGDFIAVVGPSGCGKTTLLKILAGLMSPSHGDARLRGAAITGPRRDIGVVSQASRSRRRLAPRDFRAAEASR